MHSNKVLKHLPSADRHSHDECMNTESAQRETDIYARLLSREEKHEEKNKEKSENAKRFQHYIFSYFFLLHLHLNN